MADSRGFALPFRITPGDADIAMVAGDELRAVRVETMVSTEASSAGDVGELAWDPERGSALGALRNAAASAAAADFAALFTEQALAYALPDERLRSVDVTIKNRTIDLTLKTQLANLPDRNARAISITTQIPR